MFIASVLIAGAVAEESVPFLRHHGRMQPALLHHRRAYARRSVPHEEAVEAMGQKSLDDLQPDYVFDDDFVHDGSNKYKELHKAHVKAEDVEKELAEAKALEAEEAGELEDAKTEAENLESVVAQKEAALHDAKVAVNETGTADEEAELEGAMEQLAEAEQAEESAKSEVEGEADTIEEARNKIAALEEESASLRAKHGERYKVAEDARVQFAPVKALETRLGHVDKEIEKVTRIEEKLQKERGNVTNQLQSMAPERAQLDEAEDGLAQVAKRIAEVDEEIAAWKEKLEAAEAKLSGAKHELPDDLHAAEEAQAAVDSAKQKLAAAEEDFNTEDFRHAQAKQDEVDKELDAVKEDLSKTADAVDAKKDDAAAAHQKVEEKAEVAEDALKDVEAAQDAVTTPAPEPPPPADLAWNDPSTWISGR